MDLRDERPSPDALLRAVRKEGRGRLKIFLGAAPGVGKTFEMLREGAERLAAGVDVVIAVVETHGRQETQALTAPFPIVPRRPVEHRGHVIEEMDLDAVLERRPALALVDELAHTNAPGSRHPKRWRDVEELLDAGIDVFTTLNVQHVESLNDVVASFTQVRVRETVPDRIFEDAEIEVVDLPPDELIERMKGGKVYVPAEAARALANFFTKANLSALRELALRQAAMTVDRAMLEHLDANAVSGAFGAGERVLVAVSELPGGDQLVRAGKRLADALKASWQVVFIETPRVQSFGDAERRRVADALALAAGLGASVARVPAASVVEGLTGQVQSMRATQLVLGKSVRSWWFELRHGSVVDAMLKVSDELAVHVLPALRERPAKPRAPSAPTPPPRALGRLRDYGLACVAVAVTVGLGELIQPVTGAGAIDLIMLLPVMVAAARLELGPGIFTALAAGLAFNFFFLPPLYTFTIADPHSVLTQVVLIGVALFIANLAGRLRSRAALGARSAQENAAVAAFGQALARASDWSSTSEVVCREISQVLGDRVLLLARRDGEIQALAACPEDAPPLGMIDRAAAEWSFNTGEVTGNGSGTLVSSDWQFHPLKTSLGVLAVVGLAHPEGQEPVRADQAVLLSTLLGQAALAHERLKLDDDLREVSVLKERDRLRAALLSSIGHDLRTPLTSVAAAVDALAARSPSDPDAALARAEVARLRRFMENLLSMVRLDTGALQSTPEPIDLTDAVSGAARDLKDLLKDRTLELRLPANLPLAFVDPRLLHHVLLNLLANAAVHGGAGVIRVEGRKARGGVTLTVSDEGPGLPPGQEAAVFETFARGAGSDREGGSGLGLAIAKGFSDAMGARITAANRPEGGAAFTLELRAARGAAVSP